MSWDEIYAIATAAFQKSPERVASYGCVAKTGQW
ncbi:hypothetical protein NDI45_24530 [Leptolyngbya sp. GB1-A1]